MADTTKALVIRLQEFGSNSVSMVVFPNHFEISAEFTDNGEEGKPPTELWLDIAINGMENHDYGGNPRINIPLFPEIGIPPEYFGEFIIEDAGDRVIEGMLDCISRDIAEYLMDDDWDKEPYFDITQYESSWRKRLDRYIAHELEEWEVKQPNTSESK